MKPWHFILVIVLSIGAAIGTVAYTDRHKAGDSSQHETAMDRVLRTNTLRCGYYIFPPMLTRDPKSNELSGFAVDMMNVIGKKTGLKIEWTEEVTFGTIASSLDAGRFDALCAPMWPDLAQAREIIFTRPMMFAGVGPVVRADDTRFDRDEMKLNDPSMTIVAQEGNLQLDLVQQAFPKAHVLVMPAMADEGSVVMNVVTRKADATLWDMNGVFDYNAHNPTKLKMLNPGHPVKAQSFTLGISRKEPALGQFLDNAVADMLATGAIHGLIEKWQPQPGTFLEVAEPYKSP